jgi:pyruvate, water dikinase
VLATVASVIEAARSAGRKIGICGQAPSDYPEFTRFLVERGITSISLNPDALIRGLEVIAAAESAATIPAQPIAASLAVPETIVGTRRPA